MYKNDMLIDMEYRNQMQDMKDNGISIEEFTAYQVFKISKVCPTCQKRIGVLEKRLILIAGLAIGGGAAAGASARDLLFNLFGIGG